MTEPPSKPGWIPEIKRIIHAKALRGKTIMDPGAHDGRFRIVFTDGLFVEFIKDANTASGLNIVRGSEKHHAWQNSVKGREKIRRLDVAGLTRLKRAASNYLHLERSNGDLYAYKFVQTQSNLTYNEFAIFNYFRQAKWLAELLKIPY